VIPSVTLDSSLVVALCTKETDKEAPARAALDAWQQQGAAFYAPGVLVSEVLFVLCKKRESGELTPEEHARALDALEVLCALLEPMQESDCSLFRRADALRTLHTCRDCADGLYVALAEHLSANGPAVLLTFDAGQKRMAEREAPAVTVQLLVPTSTP